MSVSPYTFRRNYKHFSKHTDTNTHTHKLLAVWGKIFTLKATFCWGVVGEGSRKKKRTIHPHTRDAQHAGPLKWVPGLDWRRLPEVSQQNHRKRSRVLISSGFNILYRAFFYFYFSFFVFLIGPFFHFTSDAHGYFGGFKFGAFRYFFFYILGVWVNADRL